MITLEYAIIRVNKNDESAAHCRCFIFKKKYILFIKKQFQAVAIRLKSKELHLREDIEKYLAYHIITRPSKKYLFSPANCPLMSFVENLSAFNVYYVLRTNNNRSGKKVRWTTNLKRISEIA